jgi:hypothetical protein
LNKALIIATTLGALVVVSGCGGSSTTSDSVVVIETVVPIETSTTQVAVMPADLGEYASSIGCIDYEMNASPIPDVVEWGICQFEATTVMKYLFESQQEQDNFFELLMGSGGVREETITKGLVVFAPESVAKLGPLSIALGM